MFFSLASSSRAILIPMSAAGIILSSMSICTLSIAIILVLSSMLVILCAPIFVLASIRTFTLLYVDVFVLSSVTSGGWVPVVGLTATSRISLDLSWVAVLT